MNMARKPLIDYDGYYSKKKEEKWAWLEKAKKDRMPLPEPTPIIFPEGTTREDVYPSDRKYHGD